MADERSRYWLIWEDDTPEFVEKPLTAKEAATRFIEVAERDPSALVEVKQCTREDLDWAGGHYADGIGSDEMDDLDDDEGDNA
jgi:hypothetical protein